MQYQIHSWPGTEAKQLSQSNEHFRSGSRYCHEYHEISANTLTVKRTTAGQESFAIFLVMSPK